MSTSPTTLTLKHLREQGYTAEVVERWNPHARIRQDLFGIVEHAEFYHSSLVGSDAGVYLAAIEREAADG